MSILTPANKILKFLILMEGEYDDVEAVGDGENGVGTVRVNEKCAGGCDAQEGVYDAKKGDCDVGGKGSKDAGGKGLEDVYYPNVENFREECEEEIWETIESLSRKRTTVIEPEVDDIESNLIPDPQPHTETNTETEPHPEPHPVPHPEPHLEPQPEPHPEPYPQPNPEHAENDNGREDGYATPYYDSDVCRFPLTDIPSEPDSDSDNEQPRYPSYTPRRGEPIIEAGMVFASTRQFRKAIGLLALTTGRAIVYVKNENDCIRAKCDNAGCPFYLYGLYVKHLKSFQVRKFNPQHSCNLSFKNRRASQSILVDVYMDRIIKNPSMRPVDLQDAVKADYNVDITFSMAKRVKKHVMDTIVANYEEQYAHLWRYAEAIRQTNPGSTVKMEVDKATPDSEPVFKRFYVCFDALKRGFLAGCRPFIGLDGCFLKSFIKGELLTAVGRDANNQLFPIAWAVVEVECYDSWTFFLELLRDDLNLERGNGMTFMTDKQKVTFYLILCFNSYGLFTFI
ncbi:MAG: hypothetical protein Q8807_02620 ['Waltheria sp.' little leaf phytoplasma]|nr:hypothetical protein ['Waltheria sp.' little leaf phytoplasma]